MQNLTFLALLTLLFVACDSNTSASGDHLRGEMDGLRARYAPDRRTDRVEVETSVRGDSILLTGYTTVAEAARRIDSLAAADPAVHADVRLLGQQDSFGLVRVSVANLRTTPGHSQELTSQALMGTPLELVDYADGWYLVRTPDRYLAWLERGAIVPATAAELAGWFGGDLYAFTPSEGQVRDAPEGGRIVSELVAGDLLRAAGRPAGTHTEVELPDGRTGFVSSDALQAYNNLSTPDGLSVSDLLATAAQQAGRPYLWGGTSPKAMDCSGFTKTAYYLNGYVIPRDASQQVRGGTDVPLDDEFSALRRGDLLFFGNHRDDGSERVTHVGFYLGEGRFLHAGADNGYITENSLIEGAPDYAAHRRASLLRARRLVPGTPDVVPIDSAFAALYTRSSSR